MIISRNWLLLAVWGIACLQGLGCTDNSVLPDGSVISDGDHDGSNVITDGSNQTEENGNNDNGNNVTYNCPQGSPPQNIPGIENMPDCAGKLAENTFRYALCSCSTVSVTSGIRVDAIESGQEGSTSGAAVGLNGNWQQTSGVMSISGSLTLPEQLRTTGATSTIGGDLRTGGDLRSTAGSYTIGRDAWVAGVINVGGFGVVEIGRNLIHPAGSGVGSNVTVGGNIIEQDFTIEPPCPCNPSEFIDIDAIVAAAQQDNDNQALGIDPDNFTLEDGDELPCGKIFLRNMGLPMGTVSVPGRTILFIDGDLSNNSYASLEVAADGELDIFISGSLDFNSDNFIGNEEAPYRVRIYVSGEISMNSDNTLAANIYAPSADFGVTSDTKIFGSLFVNSFQSTDNIKIRYDRAIISAGENCDDYYIPPTEGCSSCNDCPSIQACIDGTCTNCRDDSDCCAPLICSTDGNCIPL
jgi:hypothetical protein